MLIAAATLAALSLATPQGPDGAEVIRAAQARYAGKWFTTMTFVQKTTYPQRPAGSQLQTWYETMQVPGMLRIDIAPTSSGTGMVFRNDSLYQLAGGKVRATRAMKHSMLILLHDIHVLPAATTIANLEGLGFDLSKVHETTWEGKPVIVVGAAPGDTTAKQFWLEKERLLLVRLIEPGPGGGMDAHFGGYVRHGGAWVERVIKIHQGGKLTQLEEYFDVKTNVALEPGVFEPTRSAPPAWVGAGTDRWGAPKPE